MQNNRNASIELLRIILIIFVIGFHIISYGPLHPDHYLSLGDKYYIPSIILESIFVPAVNCFIIISGFYGIKPNLRKFINLYTQVLSYSIIIALIFSIYSICNNKDFQIIALIKSFFPIITKQWWFFSSYIILFLLSPFLNRLTKENNYKQNILLWGTLFFALCIAPSISFPFIDGRGFNFIWFIFLYLSGRIIQKYNLIISIRKAIPLYILTIFIIILYSIFLAYIGKNKGYKSSSFSYDNIIVFLEGITLFWIFIKIKITKGSKQIKAIAQTVFGIYLFHEHPLIKFQIHSLFRSYEMPFYTHIIVTLTSIFIISFFIEYARLQISKVQSVYILRKVIYIKQLINKK